MPERIGLEEKAKEVLEKLGPRGQRAREFLGTLEEITAVLLRATGQDPKPMDVLAEELGLTPERAQRLIEQTLEPAAPDPVSLLTLGAVAGAKGLFQPKQLKALVAALGRSLQPIGSGPKGATLPPVRIREENAGRRAGVMGPPTHLRRARSQ